MVVRSTRIELWPSDQLLDIKIFEFMRQNISLPHVLKPRSSDKNFKKKKKNQKPDIGRYIAYISADISPIYQPIYRRYIGQYKFF